MFIYGPVNKIKRASNVCSTRGAACFHTHTHTHGLQLSSSSGCRVDGLLCSERSDSERRSQEARAEVESTTNPLKWRAFMLHVVLESPKEKTPTSESTLCHLRASCATVECVCNWCKLYFSPLSLPCREQNVSKVRMHASGLLLALLRSGYMSGQESVCALRWMGRDLITAVHL